MGGLTYIILKDLKDLFKQAGASWVCFAECVATSKAQGGNKFCMKTAEYHLKKAKKFKKLAMEVKAFYCQNCGEMTAKQFKHFVYKTFKAEVLDELYHHSGLFVKMVCSGQAPTKAFYAKQLKKWFME
jgi:hypothetical protein